MKTGVVKFFKEDKGFGFILDNDTQEDVFVHVSGCNGKIFAGDNVEFEITAGKKGDIATNVKKI